MRLIYEGGLAIASNVALALLLALFPFLMFVASLLRLYGEAAMAHDIVTLVLGSWPGDSANAIAEQVRILLSQSPGEFFSLSTVVALVLATNGIESARDGLNRAYEVRERRPFWWRRVQGALFVVLGAVALIVSNVILVGAPFLWSFLSSRFEMLSDISFTFTLIQFGLPIALLWATLYAFHRFLPDMKGRNRSLRWGILLTLVCIIAGSKLFGLYLQYIANYTALYAGLAGMMIAIVYLYGLSALLLYGAEFNTALARVRSESENGKIKT